ncbi:MAG: RNA polymerase sigma factor [Parcubacteria group bacterium]
MQSDEQLILDYLDGGEESLAVLVDRHISAVYNFAFSLTNDAHMAEDVAQESFIKAWKNIRRFIPTKNFQTWLFAIARNTAIDKLRQKQEIVFSKFEDANGENALIATTPDDSLSPVELLENAENIIFAQQLLEQIDPLYRDVLILRYQNEMTFEEIGKILKRPLHTVKSQHRRALISLRRTIDTKTV